MSKRIRVLIVDDHPMVADGLCALLETYEDLDILGTLTNGQEVIDEVADFDPDVVLLDLNLPKVNGLTATEIMLEEHSALKIIILSMHDAPEYVSAALSHGASGYLLKDVETDEIHAALCAVMKGETYLSAGAAKAMKPSDSTKAEALTSREQSILLELAQGLSNREVGEALGISVRTVETHRKNIKRKLGISSTAGLTRYAMEHGVLQGASLGLPGGPKQ